MFVELGRSLRLTALTILVCALGYTSLILAAASIVAPEKRMGSLIYRDDGKPIGSRFVAQEFTRPEYLWPRPSAVDYNGAGAGGSNLSPVNPAIRERAVAILAKYSLANDARLPADLVLASGSGLDPHITIEAALVQLDRIASSRHVDVSIIRRLLDKHTGAQSANRIGPDGLVNVLEFNLLLDAEIKSAEAQ